MIQALILDFDGLILDTETPFCRAWEEIYDEHGLSVSPRSWGCLIGSAADPPEAYDLLEQHLGRAVDRASLRERRIRRERELRRDEQVMPGIRELIEEAGGRGLRLAIASSSDREWVVRHLAANGLLERFQVIACAEDAERTKPAPDLYEAALAGLGVSPCGAIAFEDSSHGVAAAKAAGLFCVAVPNSITRHLPFPHADRVLERLSDGSLDDLVEAAEVYYRSRCSGG